MKKKIIHLLKMFCIVFFVICCSYHQISAQTEIVVEYYDGTDEIFSVYETGKLYFDGSDLIIDENGLNTQSIAVSSIRKITMLQNEQVSVVDNNLTLTTGICIYPNPAADYVSVANAGTGRIYVELYSLSGQLLLKDNYMPDEQINISHLKTGLYILKINGEILKINKL
ncbi:MAG: T9SS type A sorting domain-containing protein [Bacteroidales bacterium]|jgi:hypothetical protein|nr:T9SS type A sorting domain-containing protein [Bacteroidales bacterium]